jgi:5-methylcytosine-specific restriction endonuclease McrA
MILEEYYRSTLWKSKREKRLEIDKKECRFCGATEYLQVHHKPQSYSKIPEESVEDGLTTLCVSCHDAITNKIRAERYEGRPIMIEAHSNTNFTRKVDKNELEKVKIMPYRSISPNLPQCST